MRASRRRLNCQAVWDLWPKSPQSRSESWSRFLTLYEAEVSGDRLFEADVEDAAVFVSHLSWEAILRRRYARAEPEPSRFFKHPDIAQCDSRARAGFRCRLGLCAPFCIRHGDRDHSG